MNVELNGPTPPNDTQDFFLAGVAQHEDKSNPGAGHFHEVIQTPEITGPGYFALLAFAVVGGGVWRKRRCARQG